MFFSFFKKMCCSLVLLCVTLHFLQPTLEAKDLALDYDSGCESDDDVDYDDEDEAEDDDNLDPFSTAPPRAANTQHSDPNSYAWTLIRYACVKLAQTTLERFIAMAGIELPGNAVCISTHMYWVGPKNCPMPSPFSPGTSPLCA